MVELKSEEYTTIDEIEMFCPEICIIMVAYFPEPSLAVARAITEPVETAVTRPDELMIACPVPFSIDQMMDGSVAFEGKTVAISCSVPPVSEIKDAPPSP